ncbi:MAG: RlmE family RNA methyltransferase [Deltaproteobacteria bacterium]|jgi:23S rRNA (uridine2552-2'-O)-methyltransferase|nr:RlmE family RNA methyltransferase [Deltaproteobacteria bacterium]
MSQPRTPDHWSRKAKAEGFPARSVYKLEEIERRFHVLPRGGGRVVDLGCCPGSWSAWVRQQGGPRLRLVGVDWQPVPNYPGDFVERSVLEVEPEALLLPLGGPADCVLSDMAPFTTGNRFTDHCVQIELAQRAIALARAILRPGGSFVTKLFEGQEVNAYVADAKQSFGEVKRVKPDATRDESVELFLVCKAFRPAPG